MFLFFGGFNLYLQMFLLLALAPAIFLMVYVYRLDPLDKEPAGLLWSLILRGVLAGLLAGALEGIGMQMLGLFSGLDPRSVQFVVVSDFLVVAAVEEGCKYWLMGKRTWNDPAFNCRYDGVVYAVFTSLGFAGMENVMYGLTYGSSVLFARAFMAIPAHMGFAVMFGLLYGEAKYLRSRGHKIGAGICIILGYLASVLLHGLYDSAAMVGSMASDGIFLLVVVVIYLVVFGLARWGATHDRRFAY